MSTQLAAVSIAQYKNVTLAEIFNQHISSPAYMTLTNDQLLCPSQLLTNTIESTPSEHSPTLISNSALELVTLDDITLQQLCQLINKANIKIEQLNAINFRANQRSYRFNISCADENFSRQKVAEFGLENKLELALILNAPTLNVPGVLVMDMDSTTIEIECIDEIAKLAGVGEQVSAVTELAMQGKLDFAQSLKQRVATLTNAPVSILAEVANNLPLMPGLAKLVTELQQHQWKVAIASGGFTYFANKLKDDLKLDAAFANELEIIDQKLTGQVLGNIVDAQVKADCLLALKEEFNIDDKQTVAMGDGANDLVMMAAASLGVAYKAKPIVLKQATTSINYSGLDCMLHWLK